MTPSLKSTKLQDPAISQARLPVGKVPTSPFFSLGMYHLIHRAIKISTPRLSHLLVITNINSFFPMCSATWMVVPYPGPPPARTSSGAQVKGFVADVRVVKIYRHTMY